MTSARFGSAVEQPADALVGLVRVYAHVELREVQAEDLDAAAQRGERTICDPRTTVGAEAAIEQLEISGEVLHRFVRVGVETSPHERELPAIRLVDVLISDLGGVGRHVELVTLDRLMEIRINGLQKRRDADRSRKLAYLVSIPEAKERACALESLPHRVWSGVRVTVGIASDPGAEAERSGRVRYVPPVRAEQLLGGVDEALFEEPVAVADFIDDTRSARSHLVGLPERRDLGRELVLDRVTPVRRVVELAEEGRDPKMRREHGSARRLCRMRGQDELQRNAPLHLVGRNVRKRLVERLRHHPLLCRIRAPTADPVLLLRHVRKLEVESERAKHARLPFEW